MSNHLFPYRWKMSDGCPAKGIESNGLKVFGTFICGGGSSMGYKLAGFDHLGGVEIDDKISQVYQTNHNPKYLYKEDIRTFNDRDDLPDELYNLDIFDGSPPCSSFSLSGNREDDWGKKKQFREGQSNQVLDDLVFVCCDTIIKLQPKTFILENVKGIIQGNAKIYAKKIVSKMREAGYTVQVFCLNAASMGVPQQRERVFFIGRKNCLKLPKLNLQFNEVGIKFGELRSKTGKNYENTGRGELLKQRINSDRCVADINMRINKKMSGFNTLIVHDDEVRGTIVAGEKDWRYFDGMGCSDQDYILCGTFPLDYNFMSKAKEGPKYIIGMSVPPVMTAQIANQICIQWFNNKS